MLNMSNSIGIMLARTAAHKHTFSRSHPLIPSLIAISHRFRSWMPQCTNCSVLGKHHGFGGKKKEWNPSPEKREHSNYTSNRKFNKSIHWHSSWRLLKASPHLCCRLGWCSAPSVRARASPGPPVSSPLKPDSGALWLGTMVAAAFQ